MLKQNHRAYRVILLLLFSIILPNIIRAEEIRMPQLRGHYTTSDGLAINGVNALCRDRRGYLWVGTYDGLNRYNGHSFTTYNSYNYPGAFRTNRIRAVAEAPNGDMWIGSDMGISIYNYATNQISPLSLAEVKQTNNSCIIKNIFVSEDKSTFLTISESDGVILYNTKGEFVGQYKLPKGGICFDAIRFGRDSYILATSNGLEYFDLKTKEYNSILPDEIKYANSVLKVSPELLIVALNKGIKKIEVNAAKREFTLHDTLYYNQTMVKTLALDDTNKVWIGTKVNGVRIVDLSNLEDANKSKHFLLGERISSILFEENGTKWIATYDNGIFKYQNEDYVFNSISPKHLKDVKKIIQVTPYSNNRVLIRSIANQLSLYNLKSGTLETLPFALNTKEYNNIRRMAYDKKGGVWLLVGYEEEACLIRIETKSGELKRICDENLPRIGRNRECILQFDDNRNLWVGTSDDICRISFSQDNSIREIERLSQNPYFATRPLHQVRVIYDDPHKNIIWIGSNTDGLYRVDFSVHNSLKEAAVNHYTHDKNSPSTISSNTITSLARTPNGTLWVGTEQGGVCKVKEQDSDLEFRSYTQRDGLSNNVVKGILTDHNGDLWISTNIGLNRFFARSEHFMSYRKEDALPFDSFNYIHVKLPNERMLFSGGNNFVEFNPIELSSVEGEPNIWFSSLSVNSQSVEPQQAFNGRVVLETGLRSGDEIKLNHDENTFEVGVDVISNTNSANYKVEYMLKPLSSNWTRIPASEGGIRFDGLQPNKYTLMVRCCNFYGVWGEPKILKLHIAPPIWETTAAYIIYLLLFIVAISAGVYVLLHIQSLRYKLRLEYIAKENLEVLNKEKQRYFSNISHELKTPLTLILAPIALLSDKFKLDVGVTRSLQVIDRQSKKMLHLIELAHNVQLEQDNLLKKELSIFDFNRFMGELLGDFSHLAECDNKHLNVNSSHSDIIIKADKSLIEKVINNLLSNAFKHTRQNDNITLSYSTNAEILNIIVEDTGYGIDENDLPHIFERFYQAKRRGVANIGGTGIGLTFSQTIVKMHEGDIQVESEFGKGTKFVVTLPVVVDTSEYDYAVEDLPDNNATIDDIKQTLVLGEMNIEAINIREELSGSLVYLVEDNPDMREFLISIVSQFYKVKSFSNGIECLEAMKGEWPDIVLSDVMMPQMDGYELCNAIKSNTLTSHIPVILLTACTTIDQKLKGLSSGADSYIPKPFYPKHVITRLDALLENRRRLRERFHVDEAILKGPSSTNKDAEFLNSLYDIFAKNLSNEDLDVESIAAELGVSRTILFQKIKALTNDSPYELLKNYKLKKAAEYLSVGDVQVSEVSFLTGFKSRTHFIKLFKDKYGHTPGKYSKLAKNGEL